MTSPFLIPLADYFNFFHDYFSTNYVAAGLGTGAGIFVISYLFFRQTSNQSFKTNLLLLMLGDSTSIWIFVLSSLAFCVSLVQQYWVSAEPTIALVSRLALFTSLGTSVILVGVFRKRAINRTYATIRNNSVTLDSQNESKFASRGNRIFESLLNKASFSKRISFTLLNSNQGLPASLAFDSSELKIIGLQKNVESFLNDDELESVIAHELGHVANHDALQKTIATGYRLAFPFDPIARFVEAAIYRNREMVADEYSAKLTSKPVSLAAALLKIYESTQSQIPKLVAPIGPASSQLSELNAKKERTTTTRNWRGKVRKLLSKQPTLQDRIERLLLQM